jgi:hypothetical protein
LNDFSLVRGNFGNIVETPVFPTPAIQESPLSAPQAEFEPIAAVGAMASMVPEASMVLEVVTQAPDVADGTYVSDASYDSASAPIISVAVVDLLAPSGVESLSSEGYVSQPQSISADNPQLASTGEYDLRPLSDDLADSDQGGDILALSELNGLVDVLAESSLVGPL